MTQRGPALACFGSLWDVELVALGLNGEARFDGFHRQLGISRKVLSQRLKYLVEQGIFERRRYQVRPDRYEYLLTRKGRDLMPVIESAASWSARWQVE